jgi:hypothetical protein
MKTLILTALVLTGCATTGGGYTAGDYLMMFLQAKANSSLGRDSYNRGLSSQYPNPMTVYQQEQFMNRQQNMFKYMDQNYGAGAVDMGDE